MKKKLLLFLLLFTAFGRLSYAGTPDLEALYKHLGEKTKYPEQARLSNIQGNSQLLFTVKDGALSDLKIAVELGSGCDVQVLNNLLAYPDFKAITNGKYALNTTFKLDGSTAPIKNETITTPEGYTALKLVIVAFAPQSQSSNVVEAPNGNKSFKANYSGNGIILRGNNGINNPKVYVDSVEVAYDDMKTIDPNQIDAIQILKGASAIATYGPDAIHGVIAITTKKATEKKLPKKEQDKNK